MAALVSLSNPKPKPTKVAGKSELLSGAYVEENAGRKFLWVTDGEGTIVRYAIEHGHEATEGYIPREALVHIEGGKKFKANREEVRIGTTYSHVNPKTKRVVDGKPRARYSREEPIWQPNEFEKRNYPVMCEIWPGRPEVRTTIRVDTTKLRAVAMALGKNVLEVEIDADDEHHDSPLLIVNSSGTVVGALKQGRT